MKVLADHARGMTFLVADGVVPSNEDRGYVLRRVMRRAIQQGRTLGLEPGYLPRFAATVRELMGSVYPELIEQADAIDKWLVAEEESFGHTREQGMRTLTGLIERARDAGADAVAAEDAFRLHDPYGFPFDLTRELLEAEGLGVDADRFEQLMGAQRTRSRAEARADVGGDLRAQALDFAGHAGAPTRFTGYESVEQQTTVEALR